MVSYLSTLCVAALQIVTAILKEIDTVARSLFPGARAVLFGSQPAGLSLPGSDLDIVILGVPPLLTNPAAGFSMRDRRGISTKLSTLLNGLVRRGLLRKKDSHVVANAKVPIIKTHIKVRVCFLIVFSNSVSNNAGTVQSVF